MKLRFKLPMAMAAASLLVLLAALVGIFQLNQAVVTYDTEVHASTKRSADAMALLGDFKTQVQEWKNVLLRGKDAQALEKHWAAFSQTESALAIKGRQLADTLPDGTARTELHRFLQAHVTMGQRYRQGLAAFKAAGLDPAAGDAAVRGMDREPAKLLDAVAVAIDQDRQRIAAKAAAKARTALWTSLVLMLAASVASGAVGVLFSRSITRPMRQAVDLTRAVASGDLSQPVSPRGDDEVAELLGALQAMQRSLHDVVGTVRLNADSVATASAQIAQGNQDLSQRTEEQAGALLQTAGSMAQLGNTARQNGDDALQAKALALGASQVAERGGDVVGQVVATMREINDSSRRIADIISVIDGIAFQTNILALNAAVEAARAGEQGRGFAVVASEVRSLAGRSADAAREIKVLIHASVARVEQGSALVDRAGETMAEVVTAIRQVTDMMGKISAASEQQSNGVAQVGSAITQIDDATRQNSALVEESAAAAGSLHQQAQALVGTVARFQLGQATAV